MGISEYEQQGIKFIDVETTHHDNITVTLNGIPMVLVRSYPEGQEVVVNVIDYPGLRIDLLRNNRPV